MHHEDWNGARVAAALSMLADAGYPQARLARMAGVNRSAINRWSRGENRPGHDAVRRLAAAVWHAHPDVARELVEASGYAWAEPSEAERPPPLISPALTAAIERELPLEDRQRVLDAIARELAGEPPSGPGEAAGSSGAGPEWRAGPGRRAG